jgi:ABC-type multidrug transport system ATPase subunit
LVFGNIVFPLKQNIARDYTALTKYPSITFNKVTFNFGAEAVLDHLSFHAAGGQHTVLKGESGSGKSTILNLLLGFELPLSGSITVNGLPLDIPEIRQQTAWLPQDLNMGTGLVKEVLTQPFEFEVNRSDEPTKKELINSLHQLGLPASTLEQQFRDLSTGERQRVGLAICHLLDKPLLLLDEPTSSLDLASKQKAARLLLKPNRTIISTSHDPFWVDKADNVITLQ